MSTKSYRLDTSQPPQVINKNEPIDSHQLIDSLPSSWIPRLQDSPSQHPAKSDRNPSSMPPADGIFWDFIFFLFKVRWSGRSGSTENQHNKFIVIIHTVQMLTVNTYFLHKKIFVWRIVIDSKAQSAPRVFWGQLIEENNSWWRDVHLKALLESSSQLLGEMMGDHGRDVDPLGFVGRLVILHAKNIQKYPKNKSRPKGVLPIKHESFLLIFFANIFNDTPWFFWKRTLQVVNVSWPPLWFQAPIPKGFTTFTTTFTNPPPGEPSMEANDWCVEASVQGGGLDWGYRRGYPERFPYLGQPAAVQNPDMAFHTDWFLEYDWVG